MTLKNQGLAAYRAGKKSEAARLLNSYLKENPEDENAYLWLAASLSDDGKKRVVLERVLAINPNNRQAIEAYRRLGGGYPSIDAIAQPAKEKKWYHSTAIKILTFLFFLPAWCLIVFSDPDSSAAVKVVASLLFLFYIFWCLLVVLPALGSG